MSTYRVTINIEFPDGDPNACPVVVTPSTQVDEVSSAITQVEWKLVLCGTIPPNDDNLELFEMVCFSDRDKTVTWFPPFFDLENGWPGARVSSDLWRVNFSNIPVPSVTNCYYTLSYRTDTCGELSWDPTMKISPRGGPGEAC